MGLPNSVKISQTIFISSVNFCANRFFSHTNGPIATKLSQDGLQVSVHPGCAQGKVKVKGHVIRALSWILGMSYSVIDGLVYDQILRQFDLNGQNTRRIIECRRQ